MEYPMSKTLQIVTAYTAEQPAVALVTALAEASDISDAEYRQIYQRLAAGRSLREIRQALGGDATVSIAWWGRYADPANGVVLSRARKDELRAWASRNGGPALPPLPPTVAEAVAAGVHADAAVYRVGAEIVNRVVLVGADVPAVTLRLNGSVGVVAEQGQLSTGAVRASTAPSRPRTPHFRPWLDREPGRRIAQLERLLAQARREQAVAAEELR
jgi:hypothetical protein